MASAPACPENAVRFNSTLCACAPGYLMEAGSRNCTLFRTSSNNVTVESGVDYSRLFPNSIVSFNSLKKFTQSQALFLEITLIVVLAWIILAVALRAGKVNGGTTVWFRLRYWITRMDVCYSTQHWLEDQKPVIKRKTELGGMFSVASAILFIGLVSTLLYQIITKRTIEVYNVRPVNAPDLSSFVNDMEFNLTTVSSMTCSHLRGLGTLMSGTPGFIDYRILPLSKFVDANCFNTSLGPRVTLRCNGCHVIKDSYFISWQFVDLPNEPATAVGFLFNITAKRPGDTKHTSFVSGTLASQDSTNQTATFRGVNGNIFKIHLVPRIYRKVHDLKLIQPLFREFVPGSNVVEASQLQSSLQNPADGLINMTLYISFLSDFIVEVDNANIIGPVTFFANVGGLYAFSIATFFFILLQLEYRIKKLHDEDVKLRDIRAKKRAQKHWDKLRKYVMFRWGHSVLGGMTQPIRQKKDSISSLVVGPFQGLGLLHKRKQHPGIYIDASKQATVPESTLTQTSLPTSEVAYVQSCEVSDMKAQEKRAISNEVKANSRSKLLLLKNYMQPLPPVPEISTDGGMDTSEMKSNLKSLYEYNVQLRKSFLESQVLLEDLRQKVSPSGDSSRDGEASNQL
ncbi:uncharacterized protein LOC116248288 [Nymphaea colorata]|nr:uncharacterized protein LOC116248288 [Nymphaea colorata]